MPSDKPARRLEDIIENAPAIQRYMNMTLSTGPSIRRAGRPHAKGGALNNGSRRFQSCSRQAFQKLRMIDAASQLIDLATLRGNRLEALKGDRKGQHSIRINDQFRVCFAWRDGDAYDVELTDYH